MAVKFAKDLLVPAWILIFGLVSLQLPIHGVAASVCLFVAGAFVVPALMLVPLGRQAEPVIVVAD